MHQDLFNALQSRRPLLRARWETRLRALPPSSALATPDTLVHLMDWTLDAFFRALARTPRAVARTELPGCPCGLNPLLAYFVAAEDALVETLFSDEVGGRADRKGALLAIQAALHQVARDEIGAFCSLCRRHRRFPHEERACGGPDGDDGEEDTQSPESSIE